MNCAQLAAMLLFQLKFTKKTAHFQQLEYMLTDIVDYNKKQKKVEDSHIEESEIKFYTDLALKVKKQGFSEDDLVSIDGQSLKEIGSDFSNID